MHNNAKQCKENATRNMCQISALLRTQRNAEPCQAVHRNAEQCNFKQNVTCASVRLCSICKGKQSNAKQCKATQSNAKQCKAMQGNAKKKQSLKCARFQHCGICSEMQSHAKQCKEMQSSATLSKA